MTEKQKRFANEYIKTLNATQSAINAGYSKKTANEQGSRLLANVNIKSYIETRLQEIQSQNIAETEEILQFLTNILRGKTTEQVVTTIGRGDGVSEAIIVDKEASIKDRLKAGELLGKRYGLYVDKVDLNADMNINESWFENENTKQEEDK